MGSMIVTDRNGFTREVEAVEGWRVMEILREHKLGIEGTCGGACSCATCHVVIAQDWAGRLPPPRHDEIDMLDTVPGLYDSSRLACQIIWDEELDGLELTIARES